MPIFNIPQVDTTANQGPSIWSTLMSGLGAAGGAIPPSIPMPAPPPAPVATPSPGLGGGAPTGPRTPVVRPQAATAAQGILSGLGGQGAPQLDWSALGGTTSTGGAMDGINKLMDTIKSGFGPSTPGKNVAGLPSVTGAEGGPPLPTGEKPGFLDTQQPPGGSDWMTGGQVVPPAAVDPSKAAQAGQAPMAGGGGARATTGGTDNVFSIPGPQAQTYWDVVNRAEGTGINPRSSAFGPGQFIDSTFRQYMKETHPEVDTSKMSHALLNEYKNKYGQDATMWYAAQNAKELAGANVPVDHASLYGAHFLGPKGAIKLYTAPDNTPVAQILDPKQIEANPEALSGKTVGQVKAWLDSKTHVLPQQPGLTAAPQQNIPPPTDFSTVRQLLAQTNVSPNEHMANVLAGLAGGAGSVAANAPGSFASALASAGAGGAKGYAQGFAAQRAAMATRAEAEMRMLSTSHAEAKEASEIAYQNAASNWKVMNENAQRRYEGEMKEREALTPKVEFKDGNLLITKLNPTTGNYDIQVHNTKPVLDQLDNIMKVAKGTGAEGPVAEAAAVNAIRTMYSNNPEMANEMLRVFTIKQMVNNGAGKQVFKDLYDDAQKEAQAEANAELGSTFAATKPLDFAAAVNDKIISKLAGNLQLKASKQWLSRAAMQGSAAARILAGEPSLTPASTITQSPNQAGVNY